MVWENFSDEPITEELFRKLFKEFYEVLCVYAFRYLDNFDEAEDVVEDFFVWFLEKKRGTKFSGSVKSYLFGAVRKAAITRAQEKGRRLFVDIEDQVNELMYEPESVNREELEEKQKKLYQEIEAIPDKCKEVFKALVIENLSYKQVAQRLEISVNTVKTHYSRALHQLRDQLDVIILLLLVEKQV